jgi:hypothetical protein
MGGSYRIWLAALAVLLSGPLPIYAQKSSIAISTGIRRKQSRPRPVWWRWRPREHDG